jgi:hypothetical protein
MLPLPLILNIFTGLPAIGNGNSFSFLDYRPSVFYDEESIIGPFLPRGFCQSKPLAP